MYESRAKSTSTHLLGSVDRRVIEGDRKLQLESEVRFEPRPGIAVAKFDRFDHPRELLRRVQLADSCRLYQENEARGAAVHDRNFRRIDVDIAVVDAKSRQRAHQMLDRRHFDVAAPDRRCHPGIDDVFRHQRNVDRRIDIDPPEHHTGIGRRRPQRQLDLGAAVQADADRAGDLLQSALFDHGVSLLTPGGLSRPASAETQECRTVPSPCPPSPRLWPAPTRACARSPVSRNRCSPTTRHATLRQVR